MAGEKTLEVEVAKPFHNKGIINNILLLNTHFMPCILLHLHTTTFISDIHEKYLFKAFT